MTEAKKTIKKQILPLLALRGITVFPFNILTFDVGRDKSMKALEEAMVNNQLIFLSAQKDAKNDEPGENDIFPVGTIAKIKQMLRLPGDTIRVLVEGLSRAEICVYKQMDPFFQVEVMEKVFSSIVEEEDEIEALKRSVMDAFEEYCKLSTRISPETVLSISTIEDASQLAYEIGNSLFLKVEQKQEILNEVNPKLRLHKLLEIMMKEIDILEIEKDIHAKVRKQMDKLQREYYLREQMKAIQSELGDKDGVAGEVEEFRERLKKENFPEEVEKKVLKELDRMSKMTGSSAEVSVVRNYLDWVFDLPWSKETKETINIAGAEKILEEDHYGLEKVKERILEYLAVVQLKKNLKGPILCLVGPPGVGKTSVARSIARALNRNYVRLSLGGVKDESEIRGHRKTYVGSMPGRIVHALKQADSKNPLMLLDEIDKMTSDFRGDPASALLEVLDGEQNFSFRDHYIELPFDLSNVLFLATANSLDTIPRPLLDRMEIIHIAGYTEEEKYNIAIKYLFPKQLEAHGLKKSALKIEPQAVRDIINYYTREAGVRSLEREIGKICRKAVKTLVTEGKKSMKLSSSTVEKLLGVQRFRYDKAGERDEVGVATGLAWTAVGGDTLSIEVSLMTGTGKIELTGHLGDVMKESARTAISFIRSRCEQWNLDKDFYSKYDIHIHVPEGATPKDGPSAGITLATAITSALTGIPVKRNVAMTGEVTLRGRVLPIGGLKEKVLAAHRAGMDTVIIPVDNKKDIDEIPETVRGHIRFVTAADMETVLMTALSRPPVRPVLSNIELQENNVLVTAATAMMNENINEHTAIEQ